jgi:hypothetical protein
MNSLFEKLCAAWTWRWFGEYGFVVFAGGRAI